MSDITWQKSSYSADGEDSDCVELAHSFPAVILLRESDTPERVITTAPAAIEMFVAAVKAGGFDRLAR